jgi:hypothetical protein
VLDNEASEAFKKEIRKNCKIQLVPPDNHRQNLSERAIQMFKNHFKAIVAGVDDSFPMRLWDKLLPQRILTLNLLRQLNVAPTVSAYAYINGPFDYNLMPLAPMGCAVQMHESTNRRTTWAENSINGWYLRTSPEHYWCNVIHMKKTRSEQISDTVWFKHKYITQPHVTAADQIVKAINDLTCALKGKSSMDGLEQIEAIQKLEELVTKTPVQEEQPAQTEPEPRVTFEPTVKPPAPPPRMKIIQPEAARIIKMNTKQMSVSVATIKKPIQKANNKHTKRVPLASVLARNQWLTLNSQRILQERAQLIHDKETSNTSTTDSSSET